SSQTTVSNSFYKFSLSAEDFPYKYNANSTFNVFGLKHHFLWDNQDYVLKIGVQYNKNKILPKEVNASLENSSFEILNQETYNYNDVSVFGDLEFSASKQLKIKAGLRLTTFVTKENALVNK